MKPKNFSAPGAPGCASHWATGAKTAIGTAAQPGSAVWFTISHGILNEIFYPEVDNACIRDMQCLVSNGKDLFCEEKKDTEHQIEYIKEGVPAFRITNTCKTGVYSITKEIITDPFRDTLLQKIRFKILKDENESYKLYLLLNPQINNLGFNNTAWIEEMEGQKLLFARQKNTFLAMAASCGWIKASAGFECVSDGWHDLAQHKQMEWEYRIARNGNVALIGEIDVHMAASESVTVSLAFGRSANEAARKALASLVNGFNATLESYISGWEYWHESLHPFQHLNQQTKHFCQISRNTLKTLTSKRFPGGMVASLSFPWGFNIESNGRQSGGYHLVWPRDAVMMATGLIAADALEEAKQVLNYLCANQNRDGYWYQNMWLDGTAYWKGVQLDQTALPVLLADFIRRLSKNSEKVAIHYWPMIRKAISFIIQNGPSTPLDRWEEQQGYTAFTIATEISALLAAADFADLFENPSVAGYLRETADYWNDNIESWTYVKNTELAQKHGVEGYYVRIMPPAYANKTEIFAESFPWEKFQGIEEFRYYLNMISVDTLALVRFGLRSPDDPRILNTLKLIDKLTKKETPEGALWHRYNNDIYGEYEDGRPYNGFGKGHPWPLLLAERAHYELSAGDMDSARQFLQFMENFANETGLFPEQIWEQEDKPEYELYRSKATGSATPLGWAHAEYLKLVRSIQEKKIFDMPPQTRERYLHKNEDAPFSVWRFKNKIKNLKHGKTLRVETLAPALIIWSGDNWQNKLETETQDTGLGIHYADLPVQKLAPGSQVVFTFYWPEANKNEDRDFRLKVI